MRAHAIATLAVILSIGVVYAQPSRAKARGPAPTPSAPAPTTILARVGPEVVTYEDIEATYLRNSNRGTRSLVSLPRDTVLEFLRLYTNYRLKVLDAISRGYDKDSSILAEVAANRRLVAETYLYEKRIIEPNVERALERRAYEVKPAVIVVTIPQGENADTTAAYAKAQACLRLVQSGTQFEQVAKDSSDDKETGRNGGVLPYITALSGVVRPLEDAVFSLKPGEVYPHPIRTRFVYILAKLLDKRPREMVRVRHILLTPTEEFDSLAVERRADSLLKALEHGAAEQFAEAARRFSSDKSSANNGGVLGGGSYYCRSLGFESDNRRLLPQFEEVLFSLRDGQVGIARTVYGVHLIRRDSTKSYNPNEEREAVRRLYRRYNFEDDKRAFLDAEKQRAGWMLRESVLAALRTVVNPSRTTRDSAWDASVSASLRAEVLYSLGTHDGLTVGAFIDSLKARREPYTLNHQGLTTALNKITDPMIITRLTAHLDREYPDFARLVREFRDGILLFKVEDQEVWSKLKFDTTLARVYWDTTQTRYRTELTYDLSEIFVLNDSMATELRKRADQTTTQEEFEKLAAEFTQRAGYREKNGHWGKVTPRTSKIAALVEQSSPHAGQVLGPLKFENGYSIIRVNAVFPPRQKTFEEAIPDLAAAVQEIKQRILTEQWLGQLRKRFPVEYRMATINKLFRK
ncbi:MAG: peptidyl-prolyl cis-trans isomerase [Candidatus Kapaibacterium sp.]|nr:MAG: peptidyl-prolyl cis-trans isomerase [Candidatus Kapabacteria bacterium]